LGDVVKFLEEMDKKIEALKAKASNLSLDNAG